MAMLKVYRGPSSESASKDFGAPKSDPAKLGGTGNVGMNVSASKVGAPHKKGVKTLGAKALKPKSQASMTKSTGSAKGY